MAQGSGVKSISKVPAFSIEDITRKFALWLQKRCREHPGFEREIAEVTFTSTNTVEQWRHGQQPGKEALLRALAYGGPHAVEEVLLAPMGMSGVRWIGELFVERLFVAQRELAAALTDIAAHPTTPVCETALDRLIEISDLVNKATKALTDLRRARNGTVVELSERTARP
jgi:hypothetical protein